jgi:hypothetical protein
MSPPPRSNQAEPSAISRKKDVALQNDTIHEENKNDSACMVNSITEEPELKSTCAESIESKDASFVEKEHGECKTTVLDFSECKGAYMSPYEFFSKQTNDHKEQQNIAE